MGSTDTTARSFSRLCLSVFVVFCGAHVLGCGGKTGLRVPDASLDGETPDMMLDAGVMPDAAMPCIEVPPPDAGTVDVPLDTLAQLRRADVLFLVDTTASMTDEIAKIRARVRDTIAPQIEREIPDAEFAVATFADFPVEPFGDPGTDHPFQMLLPMTLDLARVQAAVDSIELDNGRDDPEAQVEAMYQVATGEGLGLWISPSFGCPSGGFGYPCFRTDALPIMLLFTDAPMHNGPGNSNPYTSIAPPPHSFNDAVGALRANAIRVIGLESGGGDGRPDLETIARATGATSGGDPLVYDIGARGERLDTSVVQAIRTFADTVEFDVDAVVVDPDPSDGIDVTTMVERVVPVRAEPASGVRTIDPAAGVFRGVHAGTRVVFSLLLRAGTVSPGPRPRVVRIQIVFRGDMRTRLGERILEVVIPGIDGRGCGELDQ